MGNLATRKALIQRWDELCRDPSLEELPYKVELDSSGKVELTPRTVRRGLLVANLACQLHEKLPHGVVAISCAVLTGGGVFVPDIVWTSKWPKNENANCLESVPDLCIEVCSLDADKKAPIYLEAGAREVWLLAESGAMRYFDSSGEIAGTGFPISVTALPRPGQWQ